jgi:D-alanyl-D-alanine carboxypeptidase
MIDSVVRTRSLAWGALGAKLCVGFCAGAILLASVTNADARRRKKKSFYAPPYASIVLDAKSGRMLQGTNPDARRHPASITKVMTLYMLFEQLEQGRLNMNSPIVFSANASRQPPSKLGIRPGRSIAVKDAILALVTKSANDVAVAVAEQIGGTEPAFAVMMTAKAHALGMSRTNFANASGLPNPRQVTTARDLTRLGRAIQSHFPRYYTYFQTRSFQYGRRNYRNHNKLLGRVRGVDGIKTGYTRASGFNLLTSVRSNNRHIIAVVLGGRSGRIRDNIMANLVVNNVNRGSTRTSIAAIAKPSSSRRRFAAAATRVPIARTSVASTPVARTPVAKPRLEAMLNRRPEPRMTRYDNEDSQPAPLPPVAARPTPEPVQAAPAKVGKPVKLSAYASNLQPAVVSGASNTSDLIPTATIPGGRRTVLDGSTRSRAVYGNTVPSRSASRTRTPSDLRWVRGPGTAGSRPVPPARIKTANRAGSISQASSIKQTKAAQQARGESLRTASKRSLRVVTAAPPKAALSGVVIQIGATDDLDKAKALLSRAKSKSRGSLARAKPFTETIRKNGSTLYRARFAGLNERSAQQACRTLKRSGFGCFTTKY